MNRFDRWADALLPASLITLLFDGKREPYLMAGVICTWLVIKLLNRPDSTPYNWVLTFLLATQLHPILAQSKYPASTPSDLLITAAAFACGYAQTQAQWRRNLVFVIAILPVSLIALRPDIVSGVHILTLLDVNRNRSAFLYGLLALLSLGWACNAKRPLHRWLGAGSCLMSYSLAVATGSRAGALIPPLCAFIALAVQSVAKTNNWKTWLKISVAGVCAALVVSFIGLGWYSPVNQHAKRNIGSDRGRIDVARCFVSKATAHFETLMVGLGQGDDRVSAICAPATPYARSGKGLMHAHNTWIQMLAENGLISVLLTIGVVVASGRACWLSLRVNPGTPIPLAATAILAFIAAFACADGTLIRISLQQALQGYFLALPFAFRQSQDQKPEAVSALQT